MRAITLWQPMAWAIAEGHKPIENRRWKPPAILLPIPGAEAGPQLAIHAGKTWNEPHAQFIRGILGLECLPDKPVLGAVIAVVHLSGYTTDPSTLDPRQQRWYMGPCGWIIHRQVRKLPNPVPCRGYQTTWRLPMDVEQQVRAQL